MKYRTHTCGELRIEDCGKKVKLAGFIKRTRNYGKMLFMDLRDHYGVTQIIFQGDLLEEIISTPKESTIMVEGEVVERKDKNPKMQTGDIEVIASKVEVFSICKVNLPFEINEDYTNNKEDLRLKYRYLDLRNEKIHGNIIRRSKMLKDARDYMYQNDFIEVQTPILANSSPEGARDFLVPSRLHPGEFYALPQAPQQFKQLLMVSGFDKYFQIAPCFRDEDPRADRSPGEFYQLDFEMSFASEEDVLEKLEGFAKYIFTQNTEKEVDCKPFRRIKYNESMEIYGTDKPDLRNPLILKNVSKEFEGSNIKIFEDKNVYMLLLPGTKGRKYYDLLTEHVTKILEGKGLAWMKVEEGKRSGGVTKLITDDLFKKLIEKSDILEDKRVDKDEEEVKSFNIDKENMTVLFIADENKENAQKVAGGLRNKVGEDFDLINKNKFVFCFIKDFPFFEKNDEGNVDFSHNPFSMPKISKEDLDKLSEEELYDVEAYQYDLVGNGFELASGAVRNYDIEMMKELFEKVGYSADEVERKFTALYTAFQYGAPPHAGAALGLDRIIMLLNEEENIREVIAFPKNKKARDLMIGAPSFADQNQLDELHIKIDLEDNE